MRRIKEDNSFLNSVFKKGSEEAIENAKKYIGNKKNNRTLLKGINLDIYLPIAETSQNLFSFNNRFFCRNIIRNVWCWRRIFNHSDIDS